MALESGFKLGPYEIIEAAGAGGMGEVYKARDTRLDRIVAIKILPQSMSVNPDLRARFEREAKAISSLNHPNICTLHDVGQQDGLDYLVMEYLDGETLVDRMKKGPINLIEVYDIAIQIADALDKAHGQGLIHRDLKPGNVMLTKEGAKLMDFGLAKLHEPAQSEQADTDSEVTRSAPLTGAGTILGTIQYMSPEQLDGSDADERSDIFGFGVMLYEMLTGVKAFEAKSQAGLIAAIIEREPKAVSDIKPMLPPGLTRLVKKCLDKDPDKRWQSARDLSDELRWVAQAGSQAGISATVSARRRVRIRTASIVATVGIIAAVVFAALYFLKPEREVNAGHFKINAGTDIINMNWPQISPDGKYLAFKAVDSSRVPKIWIRPLNSLKAYPLQGTEGALRPFWSPDSKYLAYTVEGKKLKKIPINGGPAQLIGEVDNAADGSWGDNDIILLDGNNASSIKMISANGGVFQKVTNIDTGNNEQYHGWPQILPDGDHFLYVRVDNEVTANNDIKVMIGSIKSDESKYLLDCNSRVVYSKQGYIFYVKDKILLAHKFDLGSLEVIGDPIPISENIKISTGSGTPHFSVSDEGTLVFQESDNAAKSEIITLNAKGEKIETILPSDGYGDLSLSPDGTKLAYSLENPDQGTSDIWIRDLKRKVNSRLTFTAENEIGPIWSNDGKYIYYNVGILPNLNPYRKRSNGAGEAEAIFGDENVSGIVTDLSKDDKNLCFTSIGFGAADIEQVNIATKERTKLTTSAFVEAFGKYAPDERFFAYLSQESGRNELYISQTGDLGGKWQVSTTGAGMFQWAGDGKSIIYLSVAENVFRFISVPVSFGDEIQLGLPRKLFDHKIAVTGITLGRMSITKDGSTFYINSAIEQEQEYTFDVIMHWDKLYLTD